MNAAQRRIDNLTNKKVHKRCKEEIDMSQFQGKVALITGGTAGIGRATAIAFAREGAKVALTGRREKEGNGVVEEIRQLDGEALFIKTDVAKEADVKAMVEKTVETFG